MLLVGVMVAGMLVASVSATFAAHDFDDVPDDHPFHDQISWLVAEEIAAGYPDGTFRPAVDVSRQALAAFLYRMAGEPTGEWESEFPDAPEGHPFHDAISWAADQGITEGYGDNTFRPSVTVSRQAAAAFIFRAVGEPEGTWDSDFSDVPASHPFYRAISFLAAEDISGGYDDGTFRPGAGVTRQAIAAFLARTDAAGYEVDPGTTPPPDSDLFEPGEFTMFVESGSIVIGTDEDEPYVIDFTPCTDGTPDEEGDTCISLTGEIEADGDFVVQPEDAHFPVLEDNETIVPIFATTGLSAPITGNIDPVTGDATATLPLQVDIDISQDEDDDCRIVVAMTPESGTVGDLTGSPLGEDGRVSIVDSDFSVPETEQLGGTQSSLCNLVDGTVNAPNENTTAEFNILFTQQ